MRSHTPTPVPRHRALITLAAVTMAALASLVTPATPSGADPGSPIAIAEAPPLTWGFKQSWRNYVGEPAVSGGAGTVATGGGAYDLTWTFDHGTFDPATNTTVLQYRGSVHWTKYPLRDFPDWVPPGYTGSLDVPVLDVTLTDPIVTISRDRSDIVVDAVARPRETMELTPYPDSAVVSLDVSAVTPDVTGATTTWPAIRAAAGPGSFDAFGGMYPEGLAIDDVSFSYTGPGGAPDFSDLFDAPGTVKLELARNEILSQDSTQEQLALWWYDATNEITHWRTYSHAAGTTTFYAFDLTTMSRIGQPWVLSNTDPVLPTQVLFTDSAAARAYYFNTTTGTTRWLTFDATTGTYQTGPIDPAFPRGTTFSFNWDAVGRRAVNLSRTIPAGVDVRDYENHVWKVFTYTETDPGTWVREEHALPNFPTGLNQLGYATSASPFEVSMAPLPDGSLVVLGRQQTSRNPDVPNPTTYAGAHRIVLNGDGTATSQPIPGTELPADAIAYEQILTGPGGQLALLSNGDGINVFPRVQTLDWDDETGTVSAGTRLDVPGVFVLDMRHNAIDPNDGTVWLNDYTGRRMIGVRDGRIVTDQYVPQRHPRGGWIFVGDDSTVYAQTNDGSTTVPIVGIGELHRLGSSPTVTADPDDATVALGIGEASEDVTFSSSASGDPAPDRQWQVKSPGSARFVDIADATGEILTVPATPGRNGSQYRTVFSNTSGRLATEPAALTVDYAPVISIQPQDVSAVEGADARFDAVVAGNPDPEVTWQRYAAGFWWNIGPDDDGFAIDENGLTVTDAVTDQDGTRIRARVRNAVGTVYTRVATLSVAEGSEGPQQVTGGQLGWGVRQSFRSYITGSIAHGAIATSAGATTEDDGTFSFPAAAGTVDGSTVDAAFDGVVRFTGHEFQPGSPALDVRISDIRLDLDGQDGTLVADVVSRGLEDGALATYEDVTFADLDLSGISPTPVDGGLRWSAVPATLTEDGAPAFADFYEAGAPLDPVTVTLRLSDDGPAPEVTPTEAFATAALTDLLGTEPTTGQVAAAVTAIEGVGKVAFLQSLVTSDQWLGAIVDGLYADTLGRTASDADRAFWTGCIRAGWSVARVAAFFYASPEYDGHVGGGTDAAWVADLYAKLLGRAPDAPGSAYWVDQIRTRGRDDVALRFFQTPESARVRVTALYRHLLGRSPSAADVAFWGPQVVRRGDLVLAVSLAVSPEYQARAEARDA